jgi:hypothetical protein
MSDLDRYLDYVYGDKRLYYNFCTRDVSQPGKDGKGLWHEGKLAPYYAGCQDEIAGMIRRAGEKGLDAYLCAHLYADRSKPAQKPNAAPIGCLWNEADTAPLPARTDPDYPGMRVQSSPGREQWYLKLSRHVAPDIAENLTQRWAKHRGGDTGHALTKRLRPPGSRNFRRDGAESVIIEIDEDRNVDPDELDRFLPPLPDPVKRGTAPLETDADADDGPPVYLAPMDQEVWEGKRFKPTPEGDVDRSDTLQWIGYGLADGGATKKTIAAAVAERDMTLGKTWAKGPKYADRPDAATQYANIAAMAVDKARAKRAEAEEGKGSHTTFTAAPPGHDDPLADDCEDCAPDADPCAEKTRENLSLRAIIDQKDAEIGDLSQRVGILRHRIKLADDQLAIYRNPKLGAPKAVAAALVEIFHSRTPKDPNRVSRETGGPVPFRVPLGLLKDKTGLDEDTCSRHVKGGKRGKGLADYTLPDGSPLLHWDVVDVPGSVDHDTGEITMPHSELWIGPGVDLDRFAAELATLNPAQAKPWGGKRDDGVCADHPHAGVIERVHYQKHVSYECATCNKVLEEKTLTIAGKAQSIRLLRHIPTQDDAGDLPTHDDDIPAPQDAAQPATGTWDPLAYDPYVYADTPHPVPQDATPIEPGQPVAPSHLPRNLRYRAPVAFSRQVLSGPTAQEEAAGLAALAWTTSPTPLDPWTDVAIGGKP